MVLDKDLSIKRSIFSRYKKLRKSASSEVVSDVTSILEGVLESFAQQIKANDSVDGSEDISSPPKYLGQYLGTRVPSQQGTSSVASGRDCPDKLSGIYLNTKGTDPIDGVELKSMNSQSGEPGDLSSSRTFMPRDLLNRHSFSPRTRTRTPLDFRSNSFNGISNSQQVEKSMSPNLNPSLPSLRSPAGPVNPSFESSKHNPPPPHPSASHVTWHSDGDPASMAIFPASEQLWLGSLGPDASEQFKSSSFPAFQVTKEELGLAQILLLLLLPNLLSLLKFQRVQNKVQLLAAGWEDFFRSSLPQRRVQILWYK
ncbi:nucleic acid binding [Forsythia ovata]|uniref:Nucleic acid binding n=1 Tax=Forsythia ovata TaxID=205694 RepID=A0ABD1NXI5_9LAMI